MKKYKNLHELYKDMVGRPNVWTAITDINPQGEIITNGYFTRGWDFYGEGVRFWGGDTFHEIKESIIMAIEDMTRFEEPTEKEKRIISFLKKRMRI